MPKICAFIQMYNESSKGNLVRCLENVKQWADDIVIYDDGSTDDSVEVASKYTPNIIVGINSFYSELQNKQDLLNYALRFSPDWLMWIDCDEVLDRIATEGGLRRLTESRHYKDIDAFEFHEINLWRGENYARVDTYFDTGWFCRLWRVNPGIHFLIRPGVHHIIHPITIKKVERTYLQVIHYGHSNYEQSMMKQGFSHCTKEEFQQKSKKSWMFNETKCECYKVPKELFPIDCVPTEESLKPKPRETKDLVPYCEEGLFLWKQYDPICERDEQL